MWGTSVAQLVESLPCVQRLCPCCSGFESNLGKNIIMQMLSDCSKKKR